MVYYCFTHSKTNQPNIFSCCHIVSDMPTLLWVKSWSFGGQNCHLPNCLCLYHDLWRVAGCINSWLFIYIYILYKYNYNIYILYILYIYYINYIIYIYVFLYFLLLEIPRSSSFFKKPLGLMSIGRSPAAWGSFTTSSSVNKCSVDLVAQLWWRGKNHYVRKKI